MDMHARRSGRSDDRQGQCTPHACLFDATWRNTEFSCGALYYHAWYFRGAWMAATVAAALLQLHYVFLICQLHVLSAYR